MGIPVFPQEDAPGLEFPRIRWVVFCLVFFGIPAILGSYAFNQISRTREQNRQIDREQQIETVISFLQTRCRFESFFNRLLLKMSRLAFTQPNPRAAFARYSRQLKRAFPGLFEFTFLDGKGVFIDQVSDGYPYRSLWKSFFHEYQSLRYGAGEQSLTRKWSSFAPLLGPLVKPRSLLDDQMDLASSGDHRTWVFVSPLFAEGMFVCHLNRVSNYDLLPLHNRIAWFNRNRSDIHLGVVNLAADLKTQNPDSTLPDNLFPRIVAVLENNSSEIVSVMDRTWGKRLFTPNTRIYGVSPNLPDPGIERSRRRLLFGLLCLFAGATWLSLLIMIGEWRIYISIKARLIFLFCYVSGLPLTVLGIHGHDYLVERESGLRGKHHQEVQRALQLFDANLPQQTGRLQIAIATALKQPLSSGTREIDHYLARIRSACRIVPTTTAYIVDETGTYKTAFKKPLTKNDERTIRMALPFYKRLLRGLNGQSHELDNPQDAATEGVLSMAGVDLDDLFGTISLGLNRVVEYTMGTQQSLLAVFPIFHGNRADFLAVMGWSQHQFERSYVQHGLQRLERQLPNTRLCAASSLRSNEFFPLAMPFPRLVRPFLRQLRSQSHPLHRSLSTRFGSYFLTGIRGTSLREFDLVAITSDDWIRSELGDLRWRMRFLSLAFLLISATVGGLLARKFLQPVENLARGVEAIRNRQFEIRLPILDRDELGDLSQTFNEVLMGLADLEVARVVQESLFPSSSLDVGQVRIFGSCVPASQAGGDYFDYLLLPDGRIGFIIGDVAGHGVGAAMVSSMAKGLFTLLIRQDPVPAEALTRMGETLHQSLRGNRLMTCFIGIIDPRDGTFTGCNAGHCYPYLVRDHHRSEWKGPSFPLGSRRSRSFSLPPFKMQPGDSIVLYTDGMYESITRDGQMVGFPRFEEAVEKLVSGPPESSIERLRRWLREIVHPDLPQQDDITLLIVTFH